MRVLVDTSTWSHAIRRSNKSNEPTAIKLAELLSLEQSIFLTGVILLEVLKGIRSPEQFQTLVNYFAAFPILDLKRQDYISAAQLSNRCSRAGIQASTADCLIATAAMQNHCYLLTADKDFQHIAKIAPLKLL
jgi:predicted nucleic acid-binding protein